MRKILLAGICSIGLFLQKCTSLKEVAGTYSSAKQPYGFRVNKDSTFSFRYQLGPLSQTSSGKWHRVSKNLFLFNSYAKNRTLFLSAEEFTDISAKNLKINIDTKIPDAEKMLYRAEVYFNDKLFEEKRIDSLSPIILDSLANVQTIYLKIHGDIVIPGRFFDTLRTTTYRIASANTNRLNLQVQYADSLFNYRIFNAEKIKIKSNKLTFKPDGHTVTLYKK